MFVRCVQNTKATTATVVQIRGGGAEAIHELDAKVKAARSDPRET